MRAFLAAPLCMLFLLVCGPTQSQHPPQAPRVDTEEKPYGALKGKKQSQQQTGAADPASPAVPIAPAYILNNEGAHQAQQGNEEGTEYWPSFLGLRLKITDTLLALFTFLLVIATSLLWRSTVKLWRAGEKQIAVAETAAKAASQSGNAAELSAKTLMAAERAYVKMSHFSPGDYPPKLSALSFEEDRTFLVKIQVMNHGRTPATVTDLLLTYQLVPGSQAPPDPVYEGRNAQRAPGAFLVRGDVYEFAVRFPAMTADEKAAVDTGTKKLWLYGYVDYTDEFGHDHRGGYGRVYFQDVVVGNNLGFEPSGYNYDCPKDNKQ